MIIMFCGIPGSGKTATAKILSETLAKFGRVKLIVSDQILGKVYERIFRLLRKSLDEMDYILVDATFYRKEWRERVEAIAGKGNVLTCYLYCPLETCLTRNEERNPYLSERAIHIINSQMQRPPHPDISIDTERITPEQAASEIDKAIIYRETCQRQLQILKPCPLGVVRAL